MAERFVSVFVDLAKLQDYCLSDIHPRGRHKARVFRSRLGLTSNDSQTLRQVLLEVVRDRSEELRVTETDDFGQRYVLDFPMVTASGSAVLRSTWIILVGENVLRLTSCYVL